MTRLPKADGVPAPLALAEDWTEAPGPFEVVRTYWRVLVPAAVAVALLALVASQALPATYESRSQLVLTQPTGIAFSGGGDDPDGRERFAITHVEVALSSPVLSAARDQLGLDESVEDLRERVTVTLVPDTTVLEVRVRAGDPDAATALSGALADAFDAHVTAQAQQSVDDVVAHLVLARDELEAELSTINEALRSSSTPKLLDDQETVATQLRATLEELRTLERQAAAIPRTVEVLEPASTAEQTAPQPFRNAAFAAMLALVVGGGLAWWRLAALSGRPDAAEIQEALGAPLLAELPHVREIHPEKESADPGSPSAVAHQRADMLISREMRALEARSLLVTSARDGDGKTTTVTNLSLAAQRNGRWPSVATWENRDAQLQLDAPRRMLASVIDFLFPEGEPIDGGPFGDLYDWNGHGVLVDGPSLLDAGSTIAVAEQMDAALIVVRHGIGREELKELGQAVRLLDRPIVGIVINHVETDSPLGWITRQPRKK